MKTQYSDSQTPIVAEAGISWKIITSATAPVKSSFTGQVPGMTSDVTIVADNYGTAGDSITITGNGSDSVATLLSAWNGANPANTATVTSGDDSQIPDNLEVITLSGGVNAAVAAETLTDKKIRIYTSLRITAVAGGMVIIDGLPSIYMQTNETAIINVGLGSGQGSKSVLVSTTMDVYASEAIDASRKRQQPSVE